MEDNNNIYGGSMVLLALSDIYWNQDSGLVVRRYVMHVDTRCMILLCLNSTVVSVEFGLSERRKKVHLGVKIIVIVISVIAICNAFSSIFIIGFDITSPDPLVLIHVPIIVIITVIFIVLFCVFCY
jgi:hypothetical protein